MLKTIFAPILEASYFYFYFRVRPTCSFVLKVMVAAAPLAYSSVLELDRKLHGYVLEPAFDGSNLSSDNMHVNDYMQAHILQKMRCLC